MLSQTESAQGGLKLDDYLPYRLSVASNAVSGLIARAYEDRFALSVPQWRLICVLAEDGGKTQRGIVARTGMDKVTVSRAAIALVERGLMARSPNAHDKRSHLLSLTEPGRDLYAAVAPKALELEARIFSRFSGEELDVFNTMLRRIDAAAQES